MKILLAALLLTGAVAGAQQSPAQRRAERPQQHAERQTIDHVTDDDVVVLDNGDSYEALDPTVQNWEGDQVTVDDGTMVDQDKDETADVIPTEADVVPPFIAVGLTNIDP